VLNGADISAENHATMDLMGNERWKKTAKLSKFFVKKTFVFATGNWIEANH
jgi:hypothetical protein